MTIFPKTVYKILLKEKGRFITPYQRVPVELGKTYTGQFMHNETLSDTIEYDTIEGGFIHSYTSLTEAIEEKNSWGSYNKAYIIKCKIPSFTYYYEGVNKEIASRKLKYLKIND